MNKFQNKRLLWLFKWFLKDMVFFFQFLGISLHRTIPNLICLLPRCDVQQRNINLVSFLFPIEQFEKSYSRYFHFIPFGSLFREWIVLFKLNKWGHYNSPLLFHFAGSKAFFDIREQFPFSAGKEHSISLGKRNNIDSLHS